MTKLPRPLALVLVLACADRPQPAGGDTDTNTNTNTSTTTVGATETGDSNPDCQPILQDDGTPTGYEQCMSEDVIVRVESATCSDPLPPNEEGVCSAGYGECSYNADCNDAPYGACGYPAELLGTCSCIYGCMTDADCDAGMVCMCAPLYDGTRCIEADCRSDDDCDPGYRCALSLRLQWEGWPSQHCHSAADECLGDSDCPDGACRWDEDRWRCA